MKKFAIIIMISGALALGLAGCGRSKGDAMPPEARETSNRLTEALARDDQRAMSQLADSMALYVDDLSPEETIAVLLAFLRAHNAADGTDLETQRKFVDVYDIATSINPRDMEKAFDHAKRLNPEVDFRAAAREFRANLAEYDALRTYGQPDDEEKPAADSTAVATDSIPKPLSD